MSDSLFITGKRPRPPEQPGAVVQPAEEKSRRSIAPLPQEVLLHIFGFLPARDLGRASCVCHEWQQLAGDHLLWKRLFSSAFNPRRNLLGITDFKNAYKQAYLKPQIIRSNLQDGVCVKYSLYGGEPFKSVPFIDERIVVFLDDLKSDNYGVFKCCDADTGELLSQCQVEGAWSLLVHMSAFAGSKIIVTNSKDQTKIDIVDMCTGNCIGAPLAGHTDIVDCLEYAGDGKLISASTWQYDKQVNNDNSIRIWDVDSGVCLFVFLGDTNDEGELDGLYSFRYTDEKLISCYYGDEGMKIKIWDIDTGKCLRTFENFLSEDDINEECDNVNYYSGSLFTTCDSSTTIKIWSLETGECTRVITANNDSDVEITSSDTESDIEITSLECIGGKLFAFIGENENQIKIFDTSTGDCLFTLQGGEEEKFSILHADERHLISCHYGLMKERAAIKIRDINTGNCLHEIPIVGEYIFSAARYCDGKIFFEGHRHQSGLLEVLDFGRTAQK